MRVDEHTITLDESPVYYRSAPAQAALKTPPLYLHGVPTSSEDWLAFLERLGGIAPDVLGFGRSGKGGHLDYSLEALAVFVERLLDTLYTDSVSIVAHDWGAAIALRFAERHPDRVSQLVLFNPIPLSVEAPWPRVARWWRTPLLGELVMGATGKRGLTRALRRASANPDVWSRERLALVWEQFDQGTQRAILRMHRSLQEGARTALASVSAHTVVVWGERDPWFPPAVGHAYAEQLPHATFHPVVDGGHWPWFDQPHLIDFVAELLEHG